jgi:hypothetical protein
VAIERVEQSSLPCSVSLLALSVFRVPVSLLISKTLLTHRLLAATLAFLGFAVWFGRLSYRLAD